MIRKVRHLVEVDEGLDTWSKRRRRRSPRPAAAKKPAGKAGRQGARRRRRPRPRAAAAPAPARGAKRPGPPKKAAAAPVAPGGHRRPRPRPGVGRDALHEARRPRPGQRPRQDRRPRQQGPEVALRLPAPARLRGRPDAAPPPRAQARLHEHLPRRVRHREPRRPRPVRGGRRRSTPETLARARGSRARTGPSRSSATARSRRR